jgi:hypothetical protein
MAMQELEDLVEMSVKRLAQSGLSRQRLRTLYFNLFELEASYDTSFTHFRTMDELLAARFVYCLPPDEHPAFAGAKDYFASLEGFGFVDVPGHDYDGSYFNHPHLYCDAGSPLWRRLVELGRLGGSDALAPERLELPVVLEEVARLAEVAGDIKLIAYAYRLLLWVSLDEDLSVLGADPAVQRLRDTVRRSRALELRLDLLALRDPTPADVEESELVRYWFDLEAPAPAPPRRASGLQQRVEVPIPLTRRR